MININHKRGDTFELSCSVPLAFGQSLTSTTCQVRHNGDLITNLTFTAGTNTPTEYKYTLSATAAVTAAWPLAVMLMDIQYTIGAKVASTETLSITVVEDITR